MLRVLTRSGGRAISVYGGALRRGWGEPKFLLLPGRRDHLPERGWKVGAEWPLGTAGRTKDILLVACRSAELAIGGASVAGWAERSRSAAGSDSVLGPAGRSHLA